MVHIDRSSTAQLVQHLRTEQSAYLRQWILWLGLGSAGGAVAMVSLAAKLPDPDYTFRLLTPSLWAFLLGVISAGASLLVVSLREGASREHFAEAHNRDELQDAVRKMPEVIASHKRVADEANASRNDFIKESNEHHESAEAAWKWRQRWHRAFIALLVVAAAAFLVGMGWPLVYVSAGGSLLHSSGTFGLTVKSNRSASSAVVAPRVP